MPTTWNTRELHVPTGASANPSWSKTLSLPAGVTFHSRQRPKEAKYDPAIQKPGKAEDGGISPRQHKHKSAGSQTMSMLLCDTDHHSSWSWQQPPPSQVTRAEAPTLAFVWTWTAQEWGCGQNLDFQVSWEKKKREILCKKIKAPKKGLSRESLKVFQQETWTQGLKYKDMEGKWMK